jgi:hypothetical protein
MKVHIQSSPVIEEQQHIQGLLQLSLVQIHLQPNLVIEQQHIQVLLQLSLIQEQQVV